MLACMYMHAHARMHTHTHSYAHTQLFIEIIGAILSVISVKQNERDLPSQGGHHALGLLAKREPIVYITWGQVYAFDVSERETYLRR